MKRFLGTALILLAISAPAMADERALSLKDALALGLKENPELRAFERSVSAGREDIGIARSNLLPKIAFEERFMRTDNPTLTFAAKLNQERFTQADFDVASLNNPDAINDFQTSVSFEQPLYVRKAHVGLKMAKQEYSAKLEDLSRKREETAFRIVKTYFMVETAARFTEAARKGVEDAREHLRLAELRYGANLGLYSDVLRARTFMAEAEQRLTTAEKNFKVGKRALGLLLGMEEALGVTGEAGEVPLRDMSYYNEASLSRTDLKALKIRHDNAMNNVELAKSDYYPMAGLGGAYMFNDHSAPFGTEGNSWQVTAFLRWNIFDGTLRRHEAAKARYKEAEAAEYLGGLKKAISFKVYEAYEGIDEAKKNAELAEAALKAAEEGERIVRARYENSLSPMVDLLDAQAALDGARANQIAKRNDLKTAIANLSYESGTLLQDFNIGN